MVRKARKKDTDTAVSFKDTDTNVSFKDTDTTDVTDVTDVSEPKKEEIIVTDLHELAEQFEKRLDKTIEILDKLLKLKKHQMGIYE